MCGFSELLKWSVDRGSPWVVKVYEPMQIVGTDLFIFCYCNDTKHIHLFEVNQNAKIKVSAAFTQQILDLGVISNVPNSFFYNKHFTVSRKHP